MINKSILKKQDIKTLFLDNFDMKVKNIFPIYSGRSCVFKVLTNKGVFVIKEFTSEASLEDILLEIEVCRVLNEGGISTSEFLENAISEKVLKFKNRYITVQKHIKGKVYENNQAPNWLLIQSGILLRRIKHTLSTLELNRIRWEPGWPYKKDYEEALEELESIKLKTKYQSEGILNPQILKDVEYKINLINSLFGESLVDTTKLTYVNTHGDFSIRQIIVDETKRKLNIIDFETVCKMPAIWEIIRSYTYAASECKYGEINIDRFKTYLSCCTNVGELVEYDLKNIFNFYAMQLLLNTYGYTEYFKSNTCEKENYLRFGFWRTQLLKKLLTIGTVNL